MIISQHYTYTYTKKWHAWNVKSCFNNVHSYTDNVPQVILQMWWVSKGRVTLPNQMNFRKSSKRPLTPPPHFRKVTLRFSRQNCDKSAYVHMEALLCIIWSYFPWDACSTTVQRGNWLKTYPKKTLCIVLLLKKPCLKVQVLQYEFVDWKWPPSPSEL